ncbi:MAG: hypothetical protein WC881_00130 [Elusimicrobiota bacterium]|jgi:hypothetical protein
MIAPQAGPDMAAGPLPAFSFGEAPLVSGRGPILDAARAGDHYAELYSFWDNGRAGPEAMARAEPRPAAAARARAAGGVHSEVAKHAGRLDEILAAAAASPTAMKVLRSVRGLARGRGAVPVRFKELGNSLGEYDYFKNVLYLSLPYLHGDTANAAATVTHELIHILQHAQDLPAESLEMEMEAHIVTLQVMAELGIRSQPGSFSEAMVRELRKSPEAFVAFMRDQLPGKLYLEDDDFESLRDSLEDDADHYTDSTRLKWINRDLGILNSRSGRMRYRQFCVRVHNLIRRSHQALNRDT